MKTLRTPADFKLPNGIAHCQVSIIRESPKPYGLVQGAGTPQESEANKFPLCDSPEKCAEAFRVLVADEPMFDWDRETLVLFLLTTRRRLAAWQIIATGTLDSLLVHPREVFRLAIVANAAAIVLLHNHPSGDPTPSEADIRVTRDMHRAGQLLKIELLDHVVVGNPQLKSPEMQSYTSLRELGYLYA